MKQLEVSTTELPTGTTDISYSAPLAATGGIPPYRWSVSAGNLPAGLAMDSATGAISGTPANAGQTSFTAFVTDSTNGSAKSGLVLSVAAAQKSSGVSGSAGFYGPGIGANSLANTTVGGEWGNSVSYRFRAKNSGVLDQATVYLIPDHPGYAGGNGGIIRVTLHTDDGSAAHNPSSTVLATYTIANVLSLASPARYFYAMKFAAPPTLEAGQLYHFVFQNVDPLPLVNFLSVDALCEQNAPAQFQPTIPNNDEAVLLNYGAGWSARQGFTPIYQLNFSSGVTEGIGYIEVWSESPKPISGSNAVRETFTPSGSSRTVSSVGIRVARTSGGEPLVVRLENGSGGLIEEGDIDASTVPLSSASSPVYYWTTFTFATPYTLAAGSTYHLDLMASSDTSYQTFPVRKGFAYGFSASTYYPDGYAEFEQNYNWTGWTQWGATNRTDGDLQFYFTVQ